MTLQTLLNIASELGIRENLVNFCANGPSVYALNPEEIKNYPLFFLSPTDNTVVGKTQTRYGITVYYMDRLLEDSSNETQIDSVAIETLRNFLKQLENEDGIVEISEPSIRLFTSSEKMLDRVAGAYTTVNITTLNNTNCEVYLGSSHSSKNYDKEIQALSSVTNANTEQIGLLSAETADNLTKIGALSAITDSLDSKIIELSGQTSDNTAKIAEISALTEDCCTSVHRDIESLSAATETAVSGISSDISVLSASTQNLETVVASKGNVASTSVNSIWTGTQAEYDAITNPSTDTLYFITD